MRPGTGESCSWGLGELPLDESSQHLERGGREVGGIVGELVWAVGWLGRGDGAWARRHPSQSACRGSRFSNHIISLAQKQRFLKVGSRLSHLYQGHGAVFFFATTARHTHF